MSDYGKFRSRQVVIEAVRYTDDWQDAAQSIKRLAHFTDNQIRIQDHPASMVPEVSVYDKLHDTFVKVLPGQWVIKGTKGEFYPCDPEVLEQKYEDVTNIDLSKMSIGQAIEAAKSGKRIARKNWNAKDQYVYYVPEAEYPALTEVAKKEFGEKAKVPYTAYMAIKTVQNTVAPWLASQTDLLADDWYVIEGEK